MTEDITSPGVAEPEVTVAGAAVSDGAYTLFVADFSDTDTAWAAYQELKSLEDGATVAIDGVIVVKREDDGALEVQKATDHSTRSGLKWGVVGGVVLGVIFPRPSSAARPCWARPAPRAANSGNSIIARNWPNNWRTRSPPDIPGS